MCGRFVQAGAPKRISERLKIPEGSLFDRPRFNVAPTTPIAAIRESQNGGRELVAVKWGLIPSWSRDGKGFINPRSETAAEKPTFRSAFKKRRCLIPADAFYEWQKKKDGTKQPFAIRLKGGDPFAFAGLWEAWTNHQSGEEVETCTILTTGANELMKPIHDRMPVILPEDAYIPWLDQADASVLKPFEPAMASAESVRPLDSKFNRLAIQDSDGKEWTYSEGRPAKKDADADVQVEFGAASLLRDPDQQAVLRQMALGLPKKIVVQFASSAGEGSGGGFGSWTGGGGTYEYERE